MTGKVNAIISGQSGVALLMQSGELASLHAGRGTEVVRRRPSEARYLLGDATDLQVLENVALPEVSRRLELATAQMDALHVALILLDGSLSDDTRQEAARELQELTEDQAVTLYVESILFAHPLPGESDLSGAFAACAPETELTRSFLQKLQALQGLIAEVHYAWEMIPAEVFGHEERAHVRAQVAQEGLFRDLVLLRAAESPVQPFLVSSLLRSKIRNKRDILTAWVTPLCEARSSLRPYELHAEREDQFVAEASSEDQHWMGGREALQCGEVQIATIFEEMKRRRFDRVERYVTDLIDFQLRVSDPVHVCESLCNLAMKAKGLGLTQLQLNLTRRSTEIKSDDGGSWAQYGHALLSNGHLYDALAAYERAVAYDPSAEPRNGRAVVLALLERWDEALKDLPAASPVTEQDWVGYHIRGMIYLRTGRIEEALQIFRTGIEACSRPVQREYFRTALAVAQIQRRDFEAVEETLKEVTEPALEAPANLLRFHARGARGHFRQAVEARKRLQPVEGRPEYREILGEIDRRFIQRTGARWSEERLVQAEIKILLAA